MSPLLLYQQTEIDFLNLFRSYYENSYELAGAKNIVNAILVDFRGFDTMLEIFVLSMAGLGVYTLIKLRLTGRDKDETK